MRKSGRQMNEDKEKESGLEDKTMKVNEIDKNLQVVSTLNIEGLRYRSALDFPFAIYGLYQPRESGQYTRMPSETAKRVNEGVESLSLHTSGGRIRFRTDSSYVAVKVQLRNACWMPHIPLTGSHGLDLYLYENGRDLYGGSFIPPVEHPESFESAVYFAGRKMREITIHLPLYSGVEELFIGLEGDACLEAGRRYRAVKPVLYYGSSITQGGCASRPGNNYPAAIARETNVDFLCLGFSGSARGEEEMAAYLAGIDAGVFVCDYDHNAPDSAYLEETHLGVYRRYRESHPQTPVILVSRPDIRLYEAEDIRRRDVVYRTYQLAFEEGDRNVYFVDGFQLFAGNRRDDCTVDGTHPNDLGFFRMAEVIGELVKYCLPE